MTSEQRAIRLDIPRHLQDFNGYCGPACALMVIDFAGSKKSPPVFAQNEFFREVRGHAKEAADRRPIKSPAESLLHLLNDHAGGETRWEKIYQNESLPVAEAILQAVAEQAQPCLIMVNRGLHWVVAFGMLKKEDGSPSGLLMRDPAWAGMPKFYGLSIFPDQPAIEHCQSPCSCLDSINAKENKRTGKVHERFFTINELLSHRGLQGSLDWEGKGAIALVPEGASKGVARIPASIAAGVGATGAPTANAREKAGEAALTAVRESGLTGRPDSPPEWDTALKNAEAGEPILVKDPEDSRDDFYLVPLTPQDPNARQGAWAMLDAQTLALREVSLLEDWQAPILPTQENAQQASQEQVSLPDGTSAKFQPSDLTPNTKNLVWQPSAAAVLPYWPVKEFTALHPVTGNPVSVFLTQDGKPHGNLGPDEYEPPKKAPTPKEAPKPEPNPPSNKLPKPNRLGKIALTTVIAAGIPAGIWVALSDKFPNPFPRKDHNLIQNPGFENPTSLTALGDLRDQLWLSNNVDRWMGDKNSPAGFAKFTGPTNTVKPIGARMLEFAGGDKSMPAIIQVNQLTKFSSEIGAGKAAFEASVSCNVSQKANGAKATLEVVFFKEKGDGLLTETGLGLEYDLVLDGDSGSWQEIKASGAVPRDTTFVATLLHFAPQTLKGNPSYVDDAKLIIKVSP